MYASILIVLAGCEQTEPRPQEQQEVIEAPRETELEARRAAARARLDAMEDRIAAHRAMLEAREDDVRADLYRDLDQFELRLRTARADLDQAGRDTLADIEAVVDDLERDIESWGSRHRESRGQG